MGRVKAKTDYEDLRTARILENQARLATLGLHKTISDLRSITSAAKSEKTHMRKYCKVDYSCDTLRRSNRLKRFSLEISASDHAILRRSNRLPGKSDHSIPSSKEKVGLFGDDEWEKKGPANVPLVMVKSSPPQISPEFLSRRCTSKGRGSVYDPVFGICCHFCRQKKLCGEEECKRCGDLDIDQPCIGKTDCSICHSSHGVLCRACLKVRYGEEMEEVRANREWMCPHCTEDKGINPYWICNSSGDGIQISGTPTNG